MPTGVGDRDDVGRQLVNQLSGWGRAGAWLLARGFLWEVGTGKVDSRDVPRVFVGCRDDLATGGWFCVGRGRVGSDPEVRAPLPPTRSALVSCAQDQPRGPRSVSVPIE